MTAALPLQQHASYARALALLGRTARSRTLGEAGRMLVVSRGPVSLTSRGPVWAARSGADDRVAALRRHGPRLIEAGEDDATLLPRAGYVRLMTPAHIAELDLSGTPADIWARAHGKWRNRARLARRAGLRIRIEAFGGEADHWLLSAESQQRSARSYRALPPAFAIAFARANPGDAQLFVAEQAVTPIAGMLFLRHGVAATYLTGWTGDAGRKVSAHHHLLMQASVWFASRGVRRIDLGTVDTEAAPGLARFKIGSGAQILPLGGSWLRIRP